MKSWQRLAATRCYYYHEQEKLMKALQYRVRQFYTTMKAEGVLPALLKAILFVLRKINFVCSKDKKEIVMNRLKVADYRNCNEKRFWWWHIENATHDPYFYYFLTDEEKEIMAEWYIDTSEKQFIGESAPPMMSFLYGFIGGNYVRRIVQLGHYAGYSTLLIGFLLKRLNYGKLFSIDIDKDITEYTQKWIDKAKLNDYVSLFCDDSCSLAAIDKCSSYLGGAPDIVYIDSSHTYDHTIKELNTWIPILRNNGFIFLHDASEFAAEFDRTNKGGVSKAILDWSKNNLITHHPQPLLLV